MDPIQVQSAGHIVDGRTGKEVHAAVLTADLLRHGEESGHGNHNEYVVKAAVGDLQKLRNGVLGFGGVQIDQLTAAFRSFLGLALAAGVVQTVLIQIGDNHLRQTGVAAGKIHGTQTHGTGAAQDGKLAPDLGTVGTDVIAVIGMIEALIAADHAGKGFAERALEIGIPLVGDHAVPLQNDLGNHGIGGSTADVGIGITGIVARFQLQRGLNDDLLPHGPAILQRGTHLNDLTAHFVPHDDGGLGYRFGNPLMLASLLDRLIGGSTQRIGHHTEQNLVLGNGRELELLQTKIHDTVKTHGFGFHKKSS